MDSTSEKKRLREEVRERLSHSTCCPSMETLITMVLPFLKGNVLSYFPIGSEIDIRGLNERLFEEKRLFFPKITEAELKPYQVEQLYPLLSGEWGTFLPQKAKPVDIYSIDTILVPTLAADYQGNRLGRGKGYYDRLLAKHAPLTVAVISKAQLLLQLPKEVHDRALDKIIIL